MGSVYVSTGLGHGQRLFEGKQAEQCLGACSVGPSHLHLAFSEMLHDHQGNTRGDGTEHHLEIFVVVDVALSDACLLRIVHLIPGG